jgi:cytochrome c oxidase accessory protein FixG
MTKSNLTSQSEFRDKVSTISKEGKRVWIHPQKPEGRLYKLRSLVTFGYLAVFFSLPFIKTPDGHPLFLINILARKFILFGQIFWPQDFFIFGLGMIVFILFVALFTVVFGRVFCGWACPQTIFMEMVFRRIEFFFEGDAAQQKILNAAPWNGDKILRRGSKLVVFWLISFLIANTFLAYVIGVDEVKKLYTEPLSESIGTFTSLIIFTSVFFFVYSWLREQVCTVICPYGRMQGVLLDKNTVVVAYDHKRGEPRKHIKKNEVRDAGDCIDCNLCVKVCPTGIDIRNGTQLECVNCTACIDACNKMMAAVDFKPGLIRYASENNITKKRPMTFTWRMKAYSTVMVVLLGILVFLLASRTDVGVSILRTPGQLFQQQPNGEMSNLYNYKLLNKTFKDKEITLKPDNFEGEIKLVGETDMKVKKESFLSGSMFIYMKEKDVTKRKTTIKLGVYEGGTKIRTISTSFLGPFNDK